MNFSQTAPRLGGFCMRVQPKAMEKALEFFRLLTWNVLEEQVYPLRKAKFVTATPYGSPVIALVIRPDLDWGEVKKDLITFISVRSPVDDTNRITQWAMSQGWEVNILTLEENGCLFTLDEIFVSQIMFVPFKG